MESIPWNRFLGSFNVYKFELRNHEANNRDKGKTVLVVLKINAQKPEPVFVNLLRSPGIDSLADLVLGSFNIYKFGLRYHEANNQDGGKPFMSSVNKCPEACCRQRKRNRHSPHRCFLHPARYYTSNSSAHWNQCKK